MRYFEVGILRLVSLFKRDSGDDAVHMVFEGA